MSIEKFLVKIVRVDYSKKKRLSTFFCSFFPLFCALIILHDYIKEDLA